MGFLAEVTTVAVGGLLLFAGAVKIVSPSGLTDTLMQLGFGSTWARSLARFVPVLELLGGLAVVVIRGIVGATFVLSLGLLFLVAGLLAVVRRTRADCNCFGTHLLDGQLGARQVWQLPLWIVVATIVASTPEVTFDRRVLALGISALLACAATRGQE